MANLVMAFYLGLMTGMLLVVLILFTYGQINLRRARKKNEQELQEGLASLRKQWLAEQQKEEVS